MLRSFLNKAVISAFVASSAVSIAPLAVEASLPSPSRTVLSKDDVRAMIIEEAARNAVVPATLALAVARVESNFNPSAQSSAGARGVMQIMPATARGEFNTAPDVLWDARSNIRMGIDFLEQLYVMYGRDWNAALSHYNGGSIRKWANGKAVPHSYTLDYIEDVSRFWRMYEQDTEVKIMLADAQTGASLVSADRTELLGGPTPKRHPGKPLQLTRHSAEVPNDGDDPKSQRPTAAQAAPVQVAQSVIEPARQRSDTSPYSMSTQLPEGGRFDRPGISQEMADARLSFRKRLAEGS